MCVSGGNICSRLHIWEVTFWGKTNRAVIGRIWGLGMFVL